MAGRQAVARYRCKRCGEHFAAGDPDDEYLIRGFKPGTRVWHKCRDGFHRQYGLAEFIGYDLLPEGNGDENE